jgi:hypothetical protein
MERSTWSSTRGEQDWRSSVRPGVGWKKLYAQEGFSDHMRLERWSRPGRWVSSTFPRAPSCSCSQGSFTTSTANYGTHSWLRLPPGSTLTPQGSEQCELYIKEGGFPYLGRAG